MNRPQYFSSNKPEEEKEQKAGKNNLPAKPEFGTSKKDKYSAGAQDDKRDDFANTLLYYGFYMDGVGGGVLCGALIRRIIHWAGQVNNFFISSTIKISSTSEKISCAVIVGFSSKKSISSEGAVSLNESLG